jgi:hypothetical protein
MSGIADLFEEATIAPVAINGKTKHVRELSGVEIYEVYEKAGRSGTGLVVQLLTRAVCDPDGRPLATEKDIRKLPKKWLDALFDEASKLNGIGTTEKNLEADRNSVSS